MFDNCAFGQPNSNAPAGQAPAQLGVFAIEEEAFVEEWAHRQCRGEQEATPAVLSIGAERGAAQEQTGGALVMGLADTPIIDRPQLGDRYP